MDLFDLLRRNRPPPQDTARAAIDAQRGELLARLIELGHEHTICPDDRG
jgi:hypothetical protein